MGRIIEPVTTANILFLGDVGVGKSSLIKCALSEATEEQINEAKEISVEMDGIVCKINEANDAEAEQISKADVIALVYAASSKNSVKRVLKKWFPSIYCLKEEDVKIPPIILVANQVDLLMIHSPSEALALEFKNLIEISLNTYEEVELNIECSASSNFNIPQLYGVLKRAAVSPLHPLYRTTNNKLSPKATRALARIFTLCDTDKDQVLNGEEMMKLQHQVFEGGSNMKEFEELKDGLLQQAKKDPRDVFVRDGGITLEGFLHLSLNLIQNGGQEVVWQILRSYAYNNNLFISKKEIKTERFQKSAELSQRSIRILTQVFDLYCSGSNFLTEGDAKRMFATANTPLLWRDSKYQLKYPLTLQHFLNLWRMTTLVDRTITLRYLAFWGIKDSDHMLEFPKRDLRTVYYCSVLGHSQSGKTTIVNSASKSTNQRNVVKLQFSKQDTVHMKYIVLEEYDLHADDSDSKKHEIMTKSDVICIVYNGSDPHGFSKAVKTYKRLESASSLFPEVVPFFVCLKRDSLAEQMSPVSPEEFCTGESMPPPVRVSAAEIQSKLYPKILAVALRGSSTVLIKDPVTGAPQEPPTTFQKIKEGVLSVDWKLQLGISIAILVFLWVVNTKTFRQSFRAMLLPLVEALGR